MRALLRVVGLRMVGFTHLPRRVFSLRFAEKESAGVGYIEMVATDPDKIEFCEIFNDGDWGPICTSVKVENLSGGWLLHVAFSRGSIIASGIKDIVAYEH